MKVYKFGGASTANPANFDKVCRIIASQEGPLLVVASAIGKSTNHLEKILSLSGHTPSAAKTELEKFFAFHRQLAEEVIDLPRMQLLEETIEDFKKIIEEGIFQSKLKDYNFLYDQFVSTGELLATRMLSLALESRGISNTLLDARQLLLSDHHYRQARVDLQSSRDRIRARLPEALRQGTAIVQGFIAGTPDGHTTTLGREGSDYSAALFASLAGAEEVSIWKDVPGVLNADPRHYPDAVLFDQLHYDDALEISRLGAKVIHPKTIRPLKDSGIPLYVRSFLNTEAPGTLIGPAQRKHPLPPIIVHYERVAVLQFPLSAYNDGKEMLSIAEESGNLIRTIRDGEFNYLILREEAHMLELLSGLIKNQKDFSIKKGQSLVILKGGDVNTRNKIIKNKEVDKIIKQLKEPIDFIILNNKD